MSELKFVDTHVHFFDMRVPHLRYEWLEPDAEDEDLGDYGAIKAQRFWAEDFIAETRFDRPWKVVHVEHARGSQDPVAETRWIQDSADRTGMPDAHIAEVDLAGDHIEGQIEQHAEYRCFRGIRNQRYDDYLRDERWLAGYARMARTVSDLVFCDDPFVEQMPDAAALARRHPNVTLCIDHAGFPRDRTPEYHAEWRAAMSTIADVENTVVKISGLGMCDHGWTVESLRPWVEFCIEAWGPNRAVFGTNWPLDRLFSSYRDVVDAYADLITGYSPTEQDALFSGTASRVFQLD